MTGSYHVSEAYPRARVRENVIENSERTRTRTTNTDSGEMIERNEAYESFQQPASDPPSAHRAVARDRRNPRWAGSAGYRRAVR